MKIYYDYQIFLHQKFGGISKYYINLINNLDPDISKLIIAPFHKNYYLDNQNENVKKLICFDLKTRNINTISKNLNKVFTKFLYNYRTPDIFHFTYFNQKYYLKKKSSYVITVYDLIKEKFYPDQFKNEKLNKIEYFGYMDKIICISKNTKKDLIEYYKIPEELIEVVHLGVSFDKNYIKIDNMFPKKPYILFVGERSRYKNFKNFISAYIKSEKLKKDFEHQPCSPPRTHAYPSIFCFISHPLGQNVLPFGARHHLGDSASCAWSTLRVVSPGQRNPLASGRASW